MEKIVLLVFWACLLRFIWYILIIPGRHGSVVWGGVVLEGILLKIPQLLWMSAYFFLASTWKRLAAQAATMKKVNHKAQEKMDKRINMITIFMVVGLVPLYILRVAAGITMLNILVNFLMLLIIILLLYSSTFGFTLAKELGDNPLGKMIKLCCIQAINCAVVMVLGLVTNLMGMTQGSSTSRFIFWMTIHIPEIVAAQTLLVTKIKQRAKHIKHDRGSTATSTASTAATIAPDG